MKRGITTLLAVLLVLGAFHGWITPKAGAFVGTLTADQIDSAIAWAKSKLGATAIERPGRVTIYPGDCGRFVWSAFYYGCGFDLYPSRGYDNAAIMREDMRNKGLLITDGAAPPRGAMVFFDTGALGHIGLSMGDGEYIHMGSSNVNIAKLATAYNYVGWSQPFEYLLPAGSSSTTTKPTATTPSAPTGLSAVQNTSNTVTLSWLAVSGAASYEVQYQTPMSGGWKRDADYKNTAAVSYISTGLNNDYTYQYRVRAINAVGASPWAEIQYNKPALIVQPTGISVSPATLNITLPVCPNLTATVMPANAVNRSVTWKSSNPAVATVDSFGMVEPKANGTTIITATTVNGLSASCVVTVNIPASTAPHVHTAVMCGLESTAYVSVNDTYHNRIYSNGGELCECGELVVPEQITTTQEAHSFVNGTCALCGTRQSVPEAPPSTPSGLRVDYSYHRDTTNPQSYAAMISWNAASGAAYYEVEYMTSINNTWKTETDYTNNTVASYLSGGNSGMVYDRTYYFRVRAVSASGQRSGWAEVSYIRATPVVSTPTLSAPTGLRVDYSYHRNTTNPQSYAAVVSWNAVSGAAYYEVEYKTSINNTWKTETDYTSNTATSYLSGGNSGMVYGRTYYFRVRAVSATGVRTDWAEISYVQ